MAWTPPDNHVWTANEVLTASNMNTYLRLNLDFLYGDLAWTAPTYTNAWVDFGGTYRGGGYRLIGTQVYIRGVIKGGAITSSAWTMPVGYRPQLDQQFATVSNNLFGFAIVNQAGQVICQAGSNLAFSLNGIVFDTLP
jgi:hypothetical protein